MAQRRVTSATRIRVASISLTLFLGSVGALYAANDVVITTNGDRLVGEIKEVEKDVLTLPTDYSDSDFKIEWDKIVSIQSDRQFLLETFDGKRLSGSVTVQSNKAVQIGGTVVPLAEISTVKPFERSFWSRFDAGFDFGYSPTRANSAKQLSFGGTLVYRAERVICSAPLAILGTRRRPGVNH